MFCREAFTSCWHVGPQRLRRSDSKERYRPCQSSLITSPTASRSTMRNTLPGSDDTAGTDRHRRVTWRRSSSSTVAHRSIAAEPTIRLQSTREPHGLTMACGASRRADRSGALDGGYRLVSCLPHPRVPLVWPALPASGHPHRSVAARRIAMSCAPTPGARARRHPEALLMGCALAPRQLATW